MANSWDPVVGTAEYSTTLERARELAVRKGFSINPDTERVRKVIGLMTMNHNASGSYYCPCKQSHPLNTEMDVICPCPELYDEIAEDGCCGCRLFFE